MFLNPIQKKSISIIIAASKQKILQQQQIKSVNERVNQSIIGLNKKNG